MSAKSEGQDASKPFVREARAEEFDTLATLVSKAFSQDPVFNYFGKVKEPLQREIESRGTKGIKAFSLLLLRCCRSLGGRITTVVVPSSSDSGVPQEQIVSGALWLPPNKRLAVWQIITLLRNGVIPVVKKWDFGAFIRIGVNYPDVCHAAIKKEYKAKGMKESPDESWYLQLVFTDPAFEGKGMMSLLVREGYAHAPNSIFTLEATTGKSKDQYLHLGFELVSPLTIGAGSVNKMGILSSGEDATGVTFYSMVKWNNKQ